jgi:hypothetical protein
LAKSFSLTGITGNQQRLPGKTHAHGVARHPAGAQPGSLTPPPTLQPPACLIPPQRFYPPQGVKTAGPVITEIAERQKQRQYFDKRGYLSEQDRSGHQQVSGQQKSR